jgi:hypothetical protein
MKQVRVLDVLIHVCFSQEMFEQMGHPRYAKPESCACKKYITFRQAKEHVAHGDAEWLIIHKPNVKPYNSDRELVSCVAAKTPRVMTVEVNNIFYAYVYGNAEAQARITAYGELCRESIAALSREFVPDPFEGRAPWIELTGEERTSLGE